MQPSLPKRPAAGSLRRAALWAVLGLAAWSSSCDNPTCVFGENACANGGAGGGVGEATASLPFDGATILPTNPTIEALVPTGNDVHPESLVVLRASESLAPESLGGAFEMVDANFGSPIGFIDPPPVVAAGHLILLIPNTPLPPGTGILVRHSGTGMASDLTGQLLETTPTDIGDFLVSGSPSEVPRLLTSFPADGDTDQSDVSRVTLVFDRPVDAMSVNNLSFLPTVDGLVPAINPSPVPFSADFGSGMVALNQVFEWAPLELDLSPSFYPAGAEVSIELSPAATPIVDEDGDELASTRIDFDVANLSTPMSVSKVFEPTDAIGVPDLDGAAPVLQVELSTDAAVGDELELLLFGTSLGDPPQAVALLRSLPIATASALIEVSAEQLQLRDSMGAAVLAEGTIDVACRIRRGSAGSSVRTLDSDPSALGAQGLWFDVTPPEVTGLGPEGTFTTDFVTDLAGLVVTGRANEPLRAVSVSSAALGLDNGMMPDVAAASDDGLFIARGIDGVHLIDPTVAAPDFTVEVFDRALNPATAPLTGTFHQRGIVGPDLIAMPTRVVVKVFDATTLEWLSGVRVMSFDNISGTLTPLNFDFTDDSGTAEVLVALTGQTVVSVELNGYDLFTFDGIPTDRIEVPLHQIASAGALSAGSVSAPAVIDIAAETNRIGDSRFAVAGEPLLGITSCLPMGQLQTCSFGPFPIRAAELGAQSFVSVDFTVTLGTFSASSFLRAFDLDIPLAPVAATETETGAFVIDELLVTQDPERQPIAIDPRTLTAPPGFTPVGDPSVTVEGLSPALRMTVPVGAGKAFPNGAEWSVLAAYPGVVDGIVEPAGDDLPGELVERGALQADLFVRSEFVDADQNRVGSRPRLSLLPRVPSTIDPPALPALTAPALGGTSGGASYSIDVAAADPTRDGLYGVVLQDQTGRRWRLWRGVAAGGGASVTLEVPDVTLLGGSPLADGPIACSVSFYAWPSLDLGLFLWSDLDREFESFAHYNPQLGQTFTQD